MFYGCYFKRPGRWSVAWSVWKKRLGAVTPFVAIVAVLFAALQWYQTRHALFLDQRAWVSVLGTPDFPLEGVFIPASIQIADIGKTPARKIYIDAFASVLKKGEEPSFDFSKGHPHNRIYAATIFPNGPPFKLTIPVVRYGPQAAEAVIPSPELRQAIANGESFIVFYGKITYVDIFGRSHWTSFCTGLGSAMGDLKACISYNDVGDN